MTPHFLFSDGDAGHFILIIILPTSAKMSKGYVPIHLKDEQDVRESNNTKDGMLLDQRDLEKYGESSRVTAIPVYCLCKFTPLEANEILKGIAEPDYVEPTGMTFQLVPWKKEEDGTDLDMLRIAKKARRGLLVFADRDTLTDGSARMSDYYIWDDGWGEEDAEVVDGMKGEGLKWGRMELQGVLNAWMKTEVEEADLDDWVGSTKLLRWGLLESGK